MPEFEGVSETLSLQEALEAAVRKAYTAHERRTHTEPLFSYVVKRISGHLRTVTVVIETIVDDKASTPKPAVAERGPITAVDPIKALLDKQLDGFGELFRTISYEENGASSFQSRCLAGVANATYVFCLPGSSGACATGWDKLIAPQLDYRTRPCNLAELMPRLKE